MPLIHGSSTPRANVVAMTASMQSPPAASTLAPTSAALRDCAATIPALETTAALRICWLLLNCSCTLLPSLSFRCVGEKLDRIDVKTSGAPRAMPPRLLANAILCRNPARSMLQRRPNAAAEFLPTCVADLRASALQFRSRRSNQRRHRSQPDDVRQRADFALLVFAQLEQERHRYRFQLLHFAPLGIDRRAGSSGIGLAGGVDLSRDGAQRVFDAGPV